MILASFGDSFIYGSDLSDCSDKHYSLNTWPAMIANKLQLEYQCFARPGCGNRYIVNQILDNIDAKYLYIISWTWIDRYDYNQNNQWHTIRPSLDNYKIDNFYYKNLHSELHDKQTTLGLIYQTIQVLNQHNCKYVMTYIDPLIMDQTWHCPPGVNLLQQSISPHLQLIKAKTFLEWAKEEKYTISHKLHPLEDAHQAAAEYWLSNVRTLLNSSAKEEKPNASK